VTYGKKKIGVEIVYWTLLFVAVSWAFLPLLFIAISSIKLPKEIWAYPPTFKGPYSLVNYRDLITERGEFFVQLKNSLIITGGTVVLALSCAIPAAFSFSRFRNKFLRIPAFFIIAIRMLPPIVITIPLFPLFNSLRILDTHFILIVLYSAFVISLSTWIMKTFIDGVPIELEESATIDGCSRFQAFVRITMPLIRPGMFAVLIFVAIDVWNEYLFAYIFTSSNARTAPTGIAELMGGIMGVEWGMLLAASIIQLFPVLVFVWIIQRHLVKGMQIGGVKG